MAQPKKIKFPGSDNPELKFAKIKHPVSSSLGFSQKPSVREINPVLKRQIQQLFIRLIADLNKAREISIFLNDFLTPAEMNILTGRLAAAYWLKKGRSRLNIKTNLKLSDSEIHTVSASINKRGYRLAIKKMEAEEWANVWAEKIKKITRPG